ncbi:MAG: hypothetical protein AB8F78_19050 [Saprospiraceae bacterium]
MQNALNELKQQDKYANLDSQIDTSHVYLEFSLPTEEFADFDVDTSILFFDHPLWDYNQCIEFDPTDDDTQESDKAYSVVKYGELSNIEAPYTIIEYLHLPGENKEGLTEEISGQYEAYIYDLDKEAYAQIGCNFPDDDEPDVQARKSSWNPRGRVQVEEALRVFSDNSAPGIQANLLPVVGVKVTARKVFRTRSDYTDGGGYYRMGFIRGKARYRIFWKSTRVKITDGTNIVRKHVGPRVKNGEWNPILRFWTDHFMSATMINGSHQFELMRRGQSMTDPWRPSNLVNIRTKFTVGTGRMVFIGQSLKIWSRNSSSDNSSNSHKTTDQLYRVLFHELAHFSHYRQKGAVYFSDSDKCVRESYGQVVEHVFVRTVYPHMSTRSNEQTRDLSEMSDGYTPMFIDMMDTNNQFVVGSIQRPNDNVSGYSLSEITVSLRKTMIGSSNALYINYPKSQNSPLERSTLQSFFACICQPCD